jgi:hypothetical protein
VLGFLARVAAFRKALRGVVQRAPTASSSMTKNVRISSALEVKPGDIRWHEASGRF